MSYCLRQKRRKVADYDGQTSQAGLVAKDQCRYLNTYLQKEERSITDRIMQNNLECISCDNENWFMPYF